MTATSAQPQQEYPHMAFVNEYVPEEDVKKYGLKEIWDAYDPFSKGERLPGFRYTWTVDRERDIFFVPVAQGREEHSNRLTCVLWWQGARLTVKIDLADGSTGRLDATPFKTIWELVGVYKPDKFSVSQEEIIQALKEALTVFGFDGANRQVPNTLVEFKF